MPFLDSIVGVINDSIAEKLNAQKVVLSIKGISKQLPRTDVDNTQIPAYVDNSGEGIFNAIEDNYSVTIYHKCEGLVYEPVNEASFGDGENISRETANMALFCRGDRRRLQMTQEWLAATVASGFPYTITKAFKQARQGLNGAAITINNVENNSQTVWAREFQNIDYALVPESILFQINYTIETVFNKSCLELCGECPPTEERELCNCENTVLAQITDPPAATIVEIVKSDLSVIPINIIFSDFLLNPQLLVSKLLAGGCAACNASVSFDGFDIYTITVNRSSFCNLLVLVTLDPVGGISSSDFLPCPEN